jgi:hypothetical protein
MDREDFLIVPATDNDLDHRLTVVGLGLMDPSGAELHYVVEMR